MCRIRRRRRAVSLRSGAHFTKKRRSRAAGGASVSRNHTKTNEKLQKNTKPKYTLSKNANFASEGWHFFKSHVVHTEPRITKNANFASEWRTFLKVAFLSFHTKITKTQISLRSGAHFGKSQLDISFEYLT